MTYVMVDIEAGEQRGAAVIDAVETLTSVRARTGRTAPDVVT